MSNPRTVKQNGKPIDFEEMRESPERLKAFYDAAFEGIAITEDGILLDVNKRFCEMTGFERDELVGTQAVEFLVEEDRDLAAANMSSGYDKPYELKLVRKDGSILFTEVQGRTIDFQERPTRVTVIHGITERVKHEETLRQIAEGVSAQNGQAFFKSMVRHLAQALDADYAFVGNLSGSNNEKVQTVSVWANGELVDNFEYDLAQTPCDDVLDGTTCSYPENIQSKFPDDQLLIDMSIEGYVGTPLFDSSGKPIGIMVVLYCQPITNPKPMESMLEIFAARVSAEMERNRSNEALKASEQELASIIRATPDIIFRIDPQGNITFVSDAVRKYGYEPTELVGKPLHNLVYEDDLEKVLQTIEERKISGKKIDTMEVRLVPKNQDERFFSIQAEGIFETDDCDAPLFQGIQGVVRDVTEIKEADEEKQYLEKQLQQAQKLEAIGTLASGIAHDFNNILGAILGYTELAIMESEKNQKLTSYLSSIKSASSRAADLIRQILSFSRPSSREEIPVSLNLITKEAVKFLRASLPPTIEIKQTLATDGMVSADPTAALQIIMNLCTNAVQAIGDEHGVLEIDLDEIEITETGSLSELDLPSATYIRLSVKDTGSGIDPEILDKIFVPFYTTKTASNGTGLGLSTVQAIVKGYGGAINITDRVEQGTIFDVFLPKLLEPQMEEQKMKQPLPTGTETILIVDDEKTLVTMAQQMLVSLGYTVEAFSDSTTALDEFIANPNKYDLIITDQMMPVMTGDQLAQKIIAIRPDIPILLCTGLRSVIIPEKAAAVGIKEVLMKPFKRKDLGIAIRKLLDTHSGDK